VQQSVVLINEIVNVNSWMLLKANNCYRRNGYLMKSLLWQENRQQKVFCRRALDLCSGAWHSEIWTNSTVWWCFIFQFGRLGALFRRVNPIKSPLESVCRM